MENVFELDIDIKQQNYIDKPVVRQNDDVVFIINVMDDNEPFDLSDVSTTTLSVERLDANKIISAGSTTDINQVTFKLPRSSVTIVGKSKATVQMYDADNRVSTFTFPFRVEKDPTGEGWVPDDGEKTLIEIVLGEGPQVIEDAKNATENALEAAEDAAEVKDATEAVRDATETVKNETQAVKEQAEQVIEDAEEVIEATEQERLDTKAEREATEQVRQETETARDGAITATSDAIEATSDARELVDNSTHVGEYDENEEYKKGNEVRVNGSTFVALKNTTGNAPPSVNDKSNEWWELRAQRGVDGQGAVASVNGQLPNEEGDVVLEIPDPDLSGIEAQIQELEDDFHEHKEESVTIFNERVLKNYEFKNSVLNNFEGWVRIAKLDRGMSQIFNFELLITQVSGSGANYAQASIDIKSTQNKKSFKLINSLKGVQGIQKIRIVDPNALWTEGNYLDIFVKNSHPISLMLEARFSDDSHAPTFLLDVLEQDPEVPVGYRITEIELGVAS